MEERVSKTRNASPGGYLIVKKACSSYYGEWVATHPLPWEDGKVSSSLPSMWAGGKEIIENTVSLQRLPSFLMLRARSKLFARPTRRASWEQKIKMEKLSKSRTLLEKAKK